MTDALTSSLAREELLRALRIDLIGPEPGSPDESEVLTQAPSRWYLAGFLVSFEAPTDQRSDETSTEEIDSGDAGAGGDDGASPEPPSARRAFFPSSLGVSVLVPSKATTLKARVTWGDYRLLPSEPGPDSAEEKGEGGRPQWQRAPRAVDLDVPVGQTTTRPLAIEVPDSGGLRLAVSVRAVRSTANDADVALVPEGTRAVSVFLVNHRPSRPAEVKDEGLVFQAALRLTSPVPLVPRPDVRGLAAEDWDEKVADVQYRDAYEFAVGHGVATHAHVSADGRCHEVETTWVPTAEVEKVIPAGVGGVELSMEALASVDSAEDARGRLAALASGYQAWIATQRTQAPSEPQRAEVARTLLDQAAAVAQRIEAGLGELDDPQVLEAFRITNRVMAVAARRRRVQTEGAEPGTGDAPRWRPFQLAFLLMNLRGIARPEHGERETVDLLFFPTGGGKTEAYLGLAAFALVLRRLRHPGLASAGVAVLMRYTLRLLTLDQLSRAATLICALELERTKDEGSRQLLGPWPFEIGLWVGKAATPNRMGARGDGRDDTARAITNAFRANDRRRSPIPLESCPWCGTKFSTSSFSLEPDERRPLDLRVRCMSRQCAFTGRRALPIIAVDEPLYRRLPCFLIATVDKFASLPFEGRVGALFGKVDRADDNGFYGPCDPAPGRRLEHAVLPPDLVIQDELHLISGPLGTMVGLYETAIEALSSREVDGRTIKPKIVASTATVRRADSQIQALFARPRVEIFPPPGPDRRDSFFARTVSPAEANARLYVGVAAPGRSLKVVLLRSYLALLAAGQRLYAAAGGKRNANNPIDPYMTLVGYFNSLRELGGSRRIVEDEITERLQSYAGRRRAGEERGLFANRSIQYEPVELTSREPTNRVAIAKQRLAQPYGLDDAVDVALATNMISVGLDITRLGLMVVLGQPKTTAEYIQATSRVGRDDARPGLVVSLLHIHRPRDRSHYERFEAYHASFYRAVEVTSVTPFSPRAVDRGLAAVTVGMARHGWPPVTPARAAVALTSERPRVGFVADALAARATAHARLTREEEEELRQKVRARAVDLLDEWARIAQAQRNANAGLQYQKYEETGPYLIHDPLDPALGGLPAGRRKFRAHRSLRDVEPSVGLWLRRLDFSELPEEGE